MKSKFTSFAATAALLVSGTVALAGNPMPNPPFSGALYPTGPFAKSILKLEASVNGIINKALAGGAKCYQKGMSNLFGQKPDGTAACLGTLGSAKGVIPGVISSLTKLSGKAPAWCSNDVAKACVEDVDCGNGNTCVSSASCATAGLLTLFTNGTLTDLIPSLLPVAYCEGTDPANASPLISKTCAGTGASCTTDLDCAQDGSVTCSGADYGAGSLIPSDKDSLKIENSAIGMASKYGAAVAKCIDKAVAAEVKLPASSNATLCINAAKIKAADDVNKLAIKTGGVPSCLLGSGQAANIIATINTLGDAVLQVGDVLYCN